MPAQRRQPPVSPRRNELPVALRQTAVAARAEASSWEGLAWRQMAPAVARHALYPAELEVLNAVSCHSGAVSVAELEADLCATRPRAVLVILRRLQNAQLVHERDGDAWAMADKGRALMGSFFASGPVGTWGRWYRLHRSTLTFRQRKSRRG